MTLEEINKHLITVEGVKYTPITKCVRLENGEINYEIIKTAQEVYEEIKNKKIDICPEKTVEEQVTEIQQQIALLQSQVSDLVLSDLMRDEEE